MENNQGRSKTIVVLFCVTASICFSFSLGFRKIAGIFFIYIQQEFDATAAETSIVFSVLISIMFLGGPFYGACFKMLGARATLMLSSILLFIGYVGAFFSQSLVVLGFFYGAIVGIGTGLGHIGGFSLISKTFVKNRTLANNLLVACSTLLAMAAAPSFESMMKVFTWRGVMLITAAICLNGIPCGWLAGKYFKILNPTVECSRANEDGGEEIKSNTKVIKHKHTQQHKKSSNASIPWKNISNMFELSLMKDFWFCLFCLASIGLLGWRHVLAQYFVRYAQDIGISNQSAANLLTIRLFMSLFMCIIMGFVTSTRRYKIPRTAVIVVVVAYALSLIFMIPIFWEGYNGYLVFTILMGICDGCIGSLPLSLIPVYFGEERIAGALGFRSFTTGIYNLAIPPFIGYLIDISGTYKPSLFGCTILTFMGATFLIIIDIRMARKHKKEKLTLQKKEEVLV